MTLHDALVAQENLKGPWCGTKASTALLDLGEQGAPARAHSLELNMPLACLLAFLALAGIPLADLLAHAWCF